MSARVFCFLWPLFARAPCHWFLDFFAVVPGCAKCFLILETNDTGHEQKGATTKKKRLSHCGPGPRCSLTSFPGRLFRPGPAGVFFFAAAPRGRSLTHSLTHCGPGQRCLPPGYFFFCCGPARTGVVFCFLLWPRPDAHSLTVGWGDFGKARVVFFCFAAAAPPNPASQ